MPSAAVRVLCSAAVVWFVCMSVSAVLGVVCLKAVTLNRFKEALTECFTQPVKGGNDAPLFHLSVLYEHGVGSNVVAFKPAAEVVTEQKLHLCKA